MTFDRDVATVERGSLKRISLFSLLASFCPGVRYFWHRKRARPGVKLFSVNRGQMSPQTFKLQGQSTEEMIVVIKDLSGDLLISASAILNVLSQY
jgi:hypothetical protein